MLAKKTTRSIFAIAFVTRLRRCLDVSPLRAVLVTQDGLDRFILDAQQMQVGGETTTISVPPLPRQLLFAEAR